MPRRHEGMKLGRRPAVHDRRIPRFSAVVDAACLPPLADREDWYSAVKSWPMFMNDVLGCCTVTSLFHMRQAMTTYAHGQGDVVSDDVIVSAYSKVSGYVPGDDSTDTGAVLTDVLRIWMNQGFSAGPGKTERIEAYCSIRPSHVTNLKLAVQILSGVYTGLNMPLAWQDADVWDAPKNGVLTGDWEPFSWGGHCTPVHGFDDDGIIVTTWGELKRITWAGWTTFGDEAYGILDAGDWKSAAGGSPCGIDWSQLIADMGALRQPRQ